jgi:hypothetical protein
MGNLRQPWLKANGGGGEPGSGKKQCPEAPRPLRTRPSLQGEAANPSSSFADPSSPLGKLNSDDVLCASTPPSDAAFAGTYPPIPRLPPPPTLNRSSYPESVDPPLTGSFSGRISGSSIDTKERARRDEEEAGFLREDVEAMQELLKEDNARLRAQLKEANKRLAELGENPRNSLIFTPTRLSIDTPTQPVADSIASTNKRGREGECDLSRELRTGMDKMMKGIKDLSIKGGKLLSPNRDPRPRGIPNTLHGGVANPASKTAHPAGFNTANPPEHRSLDLGLPPVNECPPLIFPGSGDGPASRTRSKTNQTHGSPSGNIPSTSSPTLMSDSAKESQSMRRNSSSSSVRKRKRSSASPDNVTVMTGRKVSTWPRRSRPANAAPPRRSLRNMQPARASE